ncbi:AGAP012117-PA, partial [Anopheles gambiae str. PEST]
TLGRNEIFSLFLGGKLLTEVINTARSVFKGKKLRFEFTFASLAFRSLASTDGCTLIVFAVPTTGVDRLLNVVSKIIIPQAIIRQQKRHGSL